jgi:thiamine-monophosphate kinase
MDVSDGFLSDLTKICLASGNAARVEAAEIPIHPEATTALQQTALGMALNGGEDYELVFTAPADVIATLEGKLESGFRVIGTITDGEPGLVSVVDRDGNPLEVDAHGWDHLRP